MKDLEIVVACDLRGAIGREGKLPWHCADDMRHFKRLTTTVSEVDKINVVIMGRKTWESLPKGKKLEGRVNVVLSRTATTYPLGTDRLVKDDIIWCKSLQAAIEFVNGAVCEWIDRVFVIGGAQLYTLALQHAQCKTVHLTQIYDTVKGCDTFFPIILLLHHFILHKSCERRRFLVYKRHPRLSC